MRVAPWLRDRAEMLMPSTGVGLLSRPRRFDVVLALLLAVAIGIEIPFFSGPYPVPTFVVGFVWAAASIYRRVSPLRVMAMILTMVVAGDVLGAVANEPVQSTVGGGLAFPVVLYTVGRWVPAERLTKAIPLLVLVTPISSLFNPFNDPHWLWFLIEIGANWATIAIGLLVRNQQALRAQQVRAELAEERNQLANDIHDSVAHHMSAIAIRAEGARELDDPNQRDQALSEIRKSASTGLNDVRHLIASIRSTHDMPRPLPGFGDLHRLAEEATTDSLEIELHIDAAGETIPVTVASASYAIVREALTNVRRHATGATRATVRARESGDFLDITVTDNGATLTGNAPKTGYGVGVMTERANAVGGNLTAGPNPTGGWLVAARLPINPDPKP